jgi:hypothetical protein
MYIIAVKPARFREGYHCHLPGITVFHLWRDLDKNARANMISVVIDGEATSTSEDVIGTRDFLTDHEGVVSLLDLDIVDVEVLLIQGSK